MRVWSVSEFDNVVTSTQALIGGRLQEVQTTENDLVLGFYLAGSILWLWVDLNAVKPCLLPWTALPLRLKWHKTPLHLFLRAHFADRVLRSIERHPHEGRVVHLVFGRADEDDPPSLELRLFPHARNVLAQANGKKIAWQKPKDLEPNEREMEERLAGKLPPRPLEDLRDEWLTSRQGAGGKKKQAADPKVRLQDDLARKQKALAKVEEELQRKQDLPWKAVGDWLKMHQSLDVPPEWEPFVDKRRKLAWNIEQAFTRAREVDGKLFGTEQRLEILKQEILRVEQLLTLPPGQLPAVPEKTARPLKAIGATGRTLHLSDDMVVMAGKNAADNLKLLRKARPWDLWMHMRDYPSSHAIIFRNKNTPVGDAILNQVAAWFVRTHLGQKFAQHAGERFELLLAECRHVRPIKGDKVGRVTYTDTRGFIFKVPG